MDKKKKKKERTWQEWMRGDDKYQRGATASEEDKNKTYQYRRKALKKMKK